MSVLKIIIKSTDIVSGTWKSGESYIKQQMALEVGSDFPLPFFAVVNAPYPVGIYSLGKTAFKVDGYQNLVIDNFNLDLQLIK